MLKNRSLFENYEQAVAAEHARQSSKTRMLVFTGKE